jgi:4-hydroxy-2-oxoheptanedioate aldolase
MIVIEFEHYPFDIPGLTRFMQGLRDGGPTASGHRTPTVIAALPQNGVSADEMRLNAWQARHVLSTGVHGLLLTHARDPEAVRWFVAACRYPFQSLGREVLPEGLRGAGGEDRPARVWGVSPLDYARLADPWPLNPQGELLLGLKIETRHALPRVAEIAAVPGIAFAEWGPADMAMSFGMPGRVDPPYPQELEAAREQVRSALEEAGVAFYCGWPDVRMTPAQIVDHLIDVAGAKVLTVPDGRYADYGRGRRGRGGAVEGRDGATAGSSP